MNETQKTKINLNFNFGNSACMPVQENALAITENILHNFSDNQNNLRQLQRLHKLMFENIDIKIRPFVFKNLNFILGGFFANQENNLGLYELCFAIITCLKNQIDREAQTNEDHSEMEWEELSKSVYLLSDWHDQIVFAQNRAWQSLS